MTARATEASARAAEYVRQGLSFREAAKKAGVSLSTCQAACRRAGVVSQRAKPAP